MNPDPPKENTVNKSDRDQLIRMARDRAKVAKADAAGRVKILLSDVESTLAREFEAQDELWNQAVQIAEAEVAKANERIMSQCRLMGIPRKRAPLLTLGWAGRSGEFADSARRGELRKRAQTTLDALLAAARTAIDRACLETTEALMAGGLEDDGNAFLEAMPTVEQLMPPLALADLGVTTWAPPDSAAEELLTPSTSADRKRIRIRQALADNPGKSDRQIAAIAGVDHKTVAGVRRAYSATGPTGELPAADGEFTASDGEERSC